MIYMAIDRGDKRTGLAIGDDVLRIVSPLDVITTTSQAVLLEQIQKFVNEHEPDALVVGLPLNMDGTEGGAVTQARAFALALEKHVSKPVHLHDERLSSYAADERMSQTGLTHGQKKARRDALAAAEILQRFLDHAASSDEH